MMLQMITSEFFFGARILYFVYLCICWDICDNTQDWNDELMSPSRPMKPGECNSVGKMLVIPGDSGVLQYGPSPFPACLPCTPTPPTKKVF